MVASAHDVFQTRGEELQRPKVSFGIIVLNGEPFIRYNLRSLYPWAHEIIIVEGACEAAAATATADGHSLDSTIDSVRSFQVQEDPEHKVQLVLARDDGYSGGFWPEKTEMCQAFAKRATGNFLWQVDSDEFFRDQDMVLIFEMLSRGVGQVSFPQRSFWGGLGYINNSMFLAEFSRRGIPRLFAWEPGFAYVAHRPPMVVDHNGIDVKARGSVSSLALLRRGIYMYHYSLLFPDQVASKVLYYSTHSEHKVLQKAGASTTVVDWHNENYVRLSNPYRLHNVDGLSWIRPYRGSHPAQVLRMMDDIARGIVPCRLRQTDDIEKVVESRRYRFVTLILDTLVRLATSRVLYLPFRVMRAIVLRTRDRMQGLAAGVQDRTSVMDVD
jgi:hypothetical protein